MREKRRQRERSEGVRVEGRREGGTVRRDGESRMREKRETD